MEFKNYLEKSTEYTNRTICDIVNRVERVKKILQINEIKNDSIQELIENEYFNTLSNSVKSQLKKAIKLYIEFKGVKND